MHSTASYLRLIGTFSVCLGFVSADIAEAQYRRPPKVRINRSAPPSQLRTDAMNKFLGIVEELDALLKGIKNKEDADKAAGALVDIHNRIIDLNAEIIRIPMNLQEFNSVNRAFGSKVENAFKKLENTLGHVKGRHFFKSKALVYALAYGMSHPYYQGRRLNGEPILNAYMGNQNDEAFKKVQQRTNDYVNKRNAVHPGLIREYKKAFDQDSGRNASEFKTTAS